MSEVKDNRDAILIELAALGVEMAEVTYMGSGDDGCIEQAEAFAPIVVGQPVREIALSAELVEKLEAFVYTKLNELRPGWELDDGSRGEVTFWPLDGTIKLSHTTYYTTSDSSGHSL